MITAPHLPPPLEAIAPPAKVHSHNYVEPACVKP